MERDPIAELGGQPSPLDQTGLCLLSLDGGGVRGLSSLYILKGLMGHLNYERAVTKLQPLKPCEVFDLIGGTSTGGLIAIMLGRLEMDADEAIAVYVELMQSVFETKSRQIPVNLKGQIKPKFDSTKLRLAITKVLASRGIEEAALLNDEIDRRCKVFVCSIAHETKDVTRLRSYSVPGELDIRATIIEAALATSAATTFFDPVHIGARKFADGALSANNPADEVEAEASNIWHSGDLRHSVECFVSVGTGHPGKQAIKENIFQFLSKTLRDITTETERTAERFVARWKSHFDESRYFRFNVQHGLQSVKLPEYQEQGTIEAATAGYLTNQEQKSRMQACVTNLRQKQNTIRGSNWQPGIAKDHARQILQLRSAPHKICWSVPFARNRKFVGRHHELNKLEELLFIEGRRQKAALVGLGGAGKTQVALEYAHLTRERHPECAIFWAPAIDAETFQRAYQTIGRQLGVPGIDEKGADVKTLVQSCLSQETADEWLLIFDNADDLEMWFSTEGKEADSTRLIDYLPTSSKGSIIFTTRSWKVAGKLAYQNVIEVAEMNEDMASQILGNSLIQKEMLKDDEITLNLLTELTFLPLAIVQAAAYINVNKTTIAQYLSLLKDTEYNVISILSEDFEDEGRYRNSKNPIATTWLISFDQIRRRETLAFEYLSLMGCVEPKEIPRSLLPPGSSKKAETDAIGTLKAYSFITEGKASRSFDLHRLVHLATRNWLRQESLLREWTEKAVTRLSHIFPDGENHEERMFWSTLIPHANYILKSKDNDGILEIRAALLHKYGRCQLADGRHKEAERALSESFEIQEKLFGPEHSSTLQSMNSLAVLYRQQGQLKEAEELITKVLERNKIVLGLEHRHTLTCMSNLANAFRYQKRWEEAEELYIQVLETKKRVLGLDHPHTLISMSNLSVTLQDQGRWDEAEKVATQTLKIRKSVLGHEHPDTQLSINILARTIEGRGRWKDAEELYVQCLKTSQKVLGEDHPRLLNCMNDLAMNFYQQGRKDEAIELMAKCVQLRIEKLGKDHPDTQDSEGWLKERQAEIDS